jgi:hypothetical protein
MDSASTEFHTLSTKFDSAVMKIDKIAQLLAGRREAEGKITNPSATVD